MEEPKQPLPKGTSNNNPGNNGGNGKGRTFILYALIACVFIAIISSQFWGVDKAQQEVDAITTSQFVTAVNEDRVTEVVYHASKATLDGLYYASAEDASS